MVVPPSSAEMRWPTLGYEVVDWIQQNLVFGPGDLRGQPALLDKEKVGLILRMYEVFPRGHPEAGRRRFRRVALSLRKGSAKTELAAWIAAAEMHPDAPVRCVGWNSEGVPIGAGVTDPYIPLVAYTEEQSEELCYGALLAILQESPIVNDFDLGLTRIMRADGTGRCVALANAPAARDGARTTFQVFDETHRLVLPKQKQAHRTMLANLPKRRMADPWSLETTTAFSPGENSVAEDTMEYARMVRDGAIPDSKLFFFHRQASEKFKNLVTKEEIRAAVMDASGPVAEWSDISGIVEQWQDPKADRTFLERVWLNRPIRQASKGFDVERWKQLATPGYRPPKGALITLGFDGARFRDSTALVGTEVATGFQFLLGLWEKPPEAKTASESDTPWEVPVSEVDQAVADAFENWKVWRMYADPPYWESKVDEWAGKYGVDVVIFWWTNRNKPMAYAIASFNGAIKAGEITNDGAEGLTRHIGNAVRHELQLRDDQGRPLYVIQKERPDSIFKIDGAMAAVLSWEARGDAIKVGAAPEPEPEFQMIFVGGGAVKR